jgi:hypothetical protein
MVAHAEPGTYWHAENILQCSNYFIAYGSLVNYESRSRTVSNRNLVIPVRVSAEFGYRRVWGYKLTKKGTALGLQSVGPELADTINGVLFAASIEDMLRIDKREVDYVRVEVPWEYLESVGWLALPDHGKVWIYVPKEEELQFPTLKEPISQAYLDVTMRGFLNLSEDFAREFVETTYGWSPYWLDDRLLARRPWIHNENWDVIDRLLKEGLPITDKGYSAFEYRHYPVEYAATDNQST